MVVCNAGVQVSLALLDRFFLFDIWVAKIYTSYIIHTKTQELTSITQSGMISDDASKTQEVSFNNVKSVDLHKFLDNNVKTVDLHKSS